jgi:hypothetical protein
VTDYRDDQLMRPRRRHLAVCSSLVRRARPQLLLPDLPERRRVDEARTQDLSAEGDDARTRGRSPEGEEARTRGGRRLASRNMARRQYGGGARELSIPAADEM